MKKINIGNNFIENKTPSYIIAEAGVNHNGSLELVKKLIDAAKEVVADAVKFQTFKAENIVLKGAPKAEYQIKDIGNNKSQYEDYGVLLQIKTNELIDIHPINWNVKWLSKESLELLDKGRLAT